MAGEQNFDLGGVGDVPGYAWRHDEVPDLSANEKYGDDPDSLTGISRADDGSTFEDEPAVAAADTRHQPVSALEGDDRLHAAGGSGPEDEGLQDTAGRTGDAGDSHKADEASADKGHGPDPDTVIDIVFEAPDPPSAERLALEGALDRVYRATEGPQLPASVKNNLNQPADAVTMAAVTRISVAKTQAAETQAAAQTDGERDADLATRGKDDPAHLRAAMNESGPGKFMDALGNVDTRRDIWEPLSKPRGFAKALEEADPEGFLRTVRERDETKFWLGDPVDTRAKPDDGDQAATGYIGLILDPALVGETKGHGRPFENHRHGRKIMDAESQGLKTLWGIHGGAHRPTRAQEDIPAVRSYIDKLNKLEAEWINYNGRGVPGDPTQTVSPHHAERLEWFLTFARPSIEREGEFAADMFTAQTAREMADARIAARRQAQYREGPDAYGEGQRVDRLSEDDLADLALATRLEERAARHEDAPDAKAAEIVMQRWEEVIARQDSLYQAEVQRQHPEYFKPGVPPPVSPQHHAERFQQVGYRFRMRLGDHMPGPDESLRGRASANAGLVEDLETLMAERERTREELRLATSGDPAGFMAGDRPDGLSDEQIMDWARLAAVKLDVAMQPEGGGAGAEAEVLVEEVTAVTARDMAHRQNAAHRADPGRLYSGTLPPMAPQDVRTLVEMAAMTARVRVQQGGQQAGREFLAETARDLQRLLQGRHLHGEHAGDLTKILSGNYDPQDLDALPEDTIGVLRDAAAARVDEQVALGVVPDPDDVRRLQTLQGKADAIGLNRTGQVSAARVSASLASAEREAAARHNPTNAVHITAGPGPEKPDLLVGLLAGLGTFDRISVGGTRGVHDALRITAGREISPREIRDLVAPTPGYQSSETHIIQGRATAGIDPYSLLNDPAVQNIIIQDTPNPALINSLLQLIDPDDPRAPFHGQFSIDAARTGWVNPRTLEVDTDDESLYTVVLTRARAA